MNPPSPFEQMNSCRENDQDIASSDCEKLRALLATDSNARAQFERVKQWDRSLRSALHDVTIPADIGDRLLSMFPEEAVVGSIGSITINSKGNASGMNDAPVLRAEVDRIARRRKHFSRRRVLALASIVAAAVVGMWIVFPSDGLTRDSVGREAVGLIAGLSSSPWQSMSRSAQTAYPPAFSDSLRKPSRWKTVPTSLDAQSVVYDYRQDGSEEIFLFVSRCEAGSQLPTSLLQDPIYISGFSVGVWRHTDFVYVLAINGSAETYRMRVNRAPSLAVRTSPFSVPLLACQLPIK